MANLAVYTYKQVANERRDYEIHITHLKRTVNEQIHAIKAADLQLKKVREKYEKLLEEGKHELEGTYNDLQQMQEDWERELKLKIDSQGEPQNNIHRNEKNDATENGKFGNSQDGAINYKIEKFKKLNFQVSEEYKKMKTQLSDSEKNNIDLKKWFETTIESIKYNNANQVTDLKNAYAILLKTNNKLVKDNIDLTTKLSSEKYNFEQSLDAIHQHEDGFVVEQEKFKHYLEEFFKNVEEYTKTMKRETEIGILKYEEKMYNTCNSEERTVQEMQDTLTKFIVQLDSIKNHRKKDIQVSRKQGSSNNVHKRFEIGGKELAEDQ